MASSVIFEEQVEIPFVDSLAEFRKWALSDAFPKRGIYRRNSAALIYLMLGKS